MKSQLGRGDLSFCFGRKSEEIMYTHGYTDGGENMPLEVLLVEDSPGDVRLTQEAFRAANVGVNLHVVRTALKPWRF